MAKESEQVKLRQSTNTTSATNTVKSPTEEEKMAVRDVVFANLNRGPSFSLQMEHCDWQDLRHLERVRLSIQTKQNRQRGTCDRRNLIVPCHIAHKEKSPLDFWTHFYKAYSRFCGPQYFSMFDLTEGCEMNLADWNSNVPPFSYFCYNWPNQTFSLYVDSDFHGAYKVWTPMKFNLDDLRSGHIQLPSMIWYNKDIHDGSMRLTLHQVSDEIYQFAMIPLYSTNYSLPNAPVHEQYSAGSTLYLESYFPHMIPVLTTNGMAVFHNPRLAQSHLIMLKPFSNEIWLYTIMVCVIIAVVVTLTVERPRAISYMRYFSDNVLLIFCHIFTNLHIAEPGDFRFRAAAFVTTLWTVLSIILLTGYRSSLASHLQKPLREAKVRNFTGDEFKNDIVFLAPRFPEVLRHLRKGKAYTGSAIAIEFLVSVWGLGADTYQIPFRYESQMLQCIGETHFFACRCTQKQVRWLFEMCTMYYSVKSSMRQYSKDSMRNVNYASLARDEDAGLMAVNFEISVSFFEAWGIGLLISIAVFAKELILDAGNGM